MSEEAAAATQTTAAPPEGATIGNDANQTSPERLEAARKAGKAAAKAFTAAEEKPEAPAEPNAKTAPTDDDFDAPGAEKTAAAAAKDEPLALEVRIKQREQRIREQAASKYAERERALNQREQAIQAQTAQIANFQKMAKENPTKLFEALGFAEKDYIKTRLEDGKPEAQITQVMRALEQEKQAREQLQQQLLNEKAEQDKHKSHAEFQKLAMDPKLYPTIATVYEGAEQELVKEAYIVQAMFAGQHGRNPDLEELALNMERLERAKAVRYAKLNGKAAPAAPPATGKKGPKAIPADTSGRDQRDRVPTPEERRQRAITAYRKVVANAK